MEKLKDMIEMPFKCRVCTDCPCYDKWCNGYSKPTDCSNELLSYFYQMVVSCDGDDKELEKHEQKGKEKQSKIVHELTIEVDRDTLKDWGDPLGFMDGGYSIVRGKFDDGVEAVVKPFITLEGDDCDEVYLYKDGEEVAFTSPYNLFSLICLEYNNEEYHLQLKRG